MKPGEYVNGKEDLMIKIVRTSPYHR